MYVFRGIWLGVNLGVDDVDELVLELEESGDV